MYNQQRNEHKPALHYGELAFSFERKENEHNLPFRTGGLVNQSSLQARAKRNKKARLGGRARGKKTPYLESVVVTTKVVDGKPVVTSSTVRVAKSKAVG